MSNQIYDREPTRNDDKWTTDRLIEELSLNLDTAKEIIYIKDGKRITIHKYYHQAREKIYHIPLYRNLIPFVIHLSDLTEKVRKELIDYYNDAGERGLTMLLKLAVCRIFENLDPEYTHMSVMKNLRVRFIE
jgi:hypothetical protein